MKYVIYLGFDRGNRMPVHNFKRGDLVRIGWVTERGVKKPLLGLVTGFNVRNDFNGDARTEVICRAFFNRLEYVVEPHQIEKVS